MSSTGTDEMSDVLADEFVATDHRDLAFPDLDREGFLEINRQRDELFGEALVFTTDIHRIEGDVVLASNRMAGLTPESGVEWLHEFVNIFIVRDGRLHGLENFGPDDLDGAMARADDLLAAQRIVESSVPNVLRLGQRVVDGTAAGDFDVIRECFEEDFVRTDRRSVIALPDMNRDEYVADLQRQWELGWRDYRTVAIRSVRSNGFVALLTTDFEGGSESPFGVLVVEGSTGRIGRLVMYDADRLESAYDDLDDVWLATLDSVDAETYRIATAHYSAYVGLDDRRLDELTADDYCFIDHRRVGNFGEIDRDGFFEMFHSRQHTRGPGSTRSIAVHRLTGGLLVWSTEEHTATDDSAGGSTSSGVFLARVVEGCEDRAEIWDDDQLAEALARADELA